MDGANLRVIRFGDARGFLAAVGPFLVEHEAEHCLILGVTAMLRDHPELFEGAPILAAVAEGVVVRLALMRTPPFGAVLSRAADSAAVGPLVDDLLLSEPTLPSIEGPPALALDFARRWTAVTGQDTRVEVAERIYRLERVVAPIRPAPGAWRLAEERDRSLVADWLVAFHHEAVPESPPLTEAEAMAGRYIARVGRSMYLWEVDGRVVSMVGVGSPTPNGIRVGPVYTPPDERGRGYASALTAAASQAELDAGRRFVFLYTDLANPTSNRIYRAIGYEPVADVDRYRFIDRT